MGEPAVVDLSPADGWFVGSKSAALLIETGTTDDIAKAVVFLASDDSSYVNGAALSVDGGMAQTPGLRK